MILGRNTSDRVFCCLCDWSHAIDTIEQAEFFLGMHLFDVHDGTRLRSRVDTAPGKRTDILPLADEGADGV